MCIRILYSEALPGGSMGGGSGGSISVVFSSPAKGKLCPPSNIPNTATAYFVPALRTKPGQQPLAKMTTVKLKFNSSK